MNPECELPKLWLHKARRALAHCKGITLLAIATFFISQCWWKPALSINPSFTADKTATLFLWQHRYGHALSLGDVKFGEVKFG